VAKGKEGGGVKEVAAGSPRWGRGVAEVGSRSGGRLQIQVCGAGREAAGELRSPRPLGKREGALPRGRGDEDIYYLGDSPMVEELGRLLVPAAGCASAWYNVGDDNAGVTGLLRSSLPFGCGWWCVVWVAFVPVHEFVRVVVCALARFVPLLFLLI
jgi:hypothetical protein